MNSFISFTRGLEVALGQAVLEAGAERSYLHDAGAVPLAPALSLQTASDKPKRSSRHRTPAAGTLGVFSLAGGWQVMRF